MEDTIIKYSVYLTKQEINILCRLVYNEIQSLSTSDLRFKELMSLYESLDNIRRNIR